MEKWEWIEGYEGIYQVSTKGRIKSFKRNKETILKDKSNNIYVGVYLYKDNKRERRTIHRLVAETFISRYSDKLQINHIDGDKHNNNYSNLEWTTQKENIHHAMRMGNFTIAEKNGNSKFTNEEIKEIRMKYKPYDPRYGGSAMARKYGVSNKTMHLILNNITYVDI